MQNQARRNPVVYVAQYITDKDLSDAKRYGELRAVFVKPLWNNDNTHEALTRARENMKDYRDGDYILMIGDPILCGAAMVIALEYSETEKLQLLRWDRKTFSYNVLSFDFADEDTNIYDIV